MYLHTVDCDWFVNNKLSIHFGEDKTKSILFSYTPKIKDINLRYKEIKIKEHEYLTYVLNETMVDETMT